MNTRWETALLAIVFLFFFQLLSEFVAAVYAFGLLGVNIPAEIVSVLLFFSPLVLLLLPERLSARLQTAAGVLMLASGALSMHLDTRSRMLLSGFGTACALVYLPLVFADTARLEDRRTPVHAVSGLFLGLSLFILFRAWNSGVYPYDEAWFRIASGLLALPGCLFLAFRFSGAAGKIAGGEPRKKEGSGRTIVLCLGLFAVFTLLYLGFGSPSVIARWTGAHRLLTLGLTLAALGLFSLALSIPAVRSVLFGLRVLPALNIVFLLAMAGTIVPHGIGFPADPEAYPLAEPPVSPVAAVSLPLMLLLFPVILLDFLLLVEGLRIRRPSRRTLGAAFTLGSLFLLLMVFFQVFTTVYDYIPVIGPFFRDRFAPLSLVPGVVLLLSLSGLKKRVPADWSGARRTLPAAVILAGVTAFSGAFLLYSRPQTPVAEKESLRVLTWNIQQGYSGDGERNLRGQLALMRRLDADIIGIQESDSARAAGGNSDLVGFLADGLDMHAYSGPGVVPGTFGVALLSRFPIEDARTFYMYSAGEQTAAIHARIRVRETLFNVFVTHLGNDGDMVQQQAVLRETRGLENVLLMGDFNFRPDSAQYGVSTERLADAWLSGRQEGADGAGFSPGKRIDHLFASRELVVSTARYLAGPESDHPALLADIAR